MRIEARQAIDKMKTSSQISIGSSFFSLDIIFPSKHNVPNVYETSISQFMLNFFISEFFFNVIFFFILRTKC